MTAELDGYYADACDTVAVGPARPRARAPRRRRRPPRCAGASRPHAPGAPIYAIGAARRAPRSAPRLPRLRELTGHGIGRRIHEPPTVANVFDPRRGEPLTEGLVITVEPIIAAGTGEVHMPTTAGRSATDDGSPAAHAEHTIVITAGRPLVLTA